MYSSRLTAFENMQRNMLDYRERSRIELGRLDESYNNRWIGQERGVGGLYEATIGYARRAASSRRGFESLMEQGRIQEAEKVKSQWQYEAGERNSLADQLLQIIGNKTADLTNVTSLASMGFGMGEVNDNVDRQMKVWEEQATLQREIKNILNEKTFAATYGD